MKISTGMSTSQKREFLTAGFQNIRVGYLKHKDFGATVEALYSKFKPGNPIPFMVFKDTGNCTPVGMKFCELFVHEDKEDIKTMAKCLVKAIDRLCLNYELQDKLVSDLMNVINKSKLSDHPGLIEAKMKLWIMLPKEQQEQMKMVA